jgi:glycosyltransferase involved in cell wall biosynthesis
MTPVTHPQAPTNEPAERSAEGTGRATSTDAKNTPGVADGRGEPSRDSVASLFAELPRRPRIALVHDWLCGYRGGEGVLERIARVVLDHADAAGLWVMVSDGRPVAPAVDSLEVRASCLQEIPFAATTLRRHLLPLYPRAVADLSRMIAEEHGRRPIDLVISTSSAAVKGVRAPAGVPHLCYCHTPPRYLWSQRGEYSSGGLLVSAGLRAAGPFLRAWDRRSAEHVTSFIANSSHTAEQIRACYGRESTVIHPPVRTEFFTPGDGGDDADKARAAAVGASDDVAGDEGSGAWLVAGALEPYKRADLAIDAANRMGRRLLVVGTGSCLKRLRRRAGPTVEFLGRVTDERLRRLYRGADALLFPQVEDFGIVAVEAQACGTPVIARRAGGSLDTVIDGVTGALFDEPTVESLVAAAEGVASKPRTAWSAACRANARRFRVSEFDRRIAESVIRLLCGSMNR